MPLAAKLLFSGILFIMYSGELPAKQEGLINPHNKNIKYTGRTDSSEPDKVLFAFPAVTVSSGFTGEKIGIVLEDLPYGQDNNYFNVIIDEQEPEVLKLKKGKSTYWFSTFLKKDKHTVSLVKRTESQVGKVAFYGFITEEGHRLVPGKGLSEKTIEFIGNSITCGYGNEAEIAAPPEGNPSTGFTAANENAYNSYASMTGRKLDANILLTSYSGKGLYRNFSGDTTNTIPELYDLILPDEPKGPAWNPALFQPALIVINLGTNDYYLEAHNKPLDDRVFVEHYIQFLKKLMNYYPETVFVCTTGPMLSDSHPEGKRCLSRMKNNLKEIEAYFEKAGAGKKVYSLSFAPQQPPYGEDWHPALHTHKNMAEVLSDYITSNIWKN